jgi:hypothetical protein
MAEAFRHQHRKNPRDQECRKRPVLRLRHLGATQRVLRRRVRDQGQAERSVAGRAKQQRLRKDVGIWRRHPPRLLAVGLALRSLRAERGLRPRGLANQAGESQQRDKTRLLSALVS